MKRLGLTTGAPRRAGAGWVVIFAVAWAACPADPPNARRIVNNYVKSTGLTFTDCGVVETNQCSVWVPTAADDAAMQCLLHGLAACAPTRLRQDVPEVVEVLLERQRLVVQIAQTHRQPPLLLGLAQRG